MRIDDTQTWSVVQLNKVICKISAQYVKACKRNSGKLCIFSILSYKRGITPTQANSKNCGPPPDNKFDLEIGQRSRSRSQYGTNRKGLSQWSFIPNINAVSLKLQKIWARLKFLWQTEGQTNRQTDEWDLMSPDFAKGGGQKSDGNLWHLNLIWSTVKQSHMQNFSSICQSM